MMNSDISYLPLIFSHVLYGVSCHCHTLERASLTNDNSKIPSTTFTIIAHLVLLVAI